MVDILTQQTPGTLIWHSNQPFVAHIKIDAKCGTQNLVSATHPTPPHHNIHNTLKGFQDTVKVVVIVVVVVMICHCWCEGCSPEQKLSICQVVQSPH